MSYNCSVKVMALRSFTVPVGDIPEALVTNFEVVLEAFPVLDPESVTIRTCAEDGFIGGMVLRDGEGIRLHVDEVVCYGTLSGYVWRELFRDYLFKHSTGYAKFLVIWEEGDKVEVIEVKDGNVHETLATEALKEFTAVA